MKKTALEKLISEKARKKYLEDLKEVVQLVQDNPILRNLDIKIGDQSVKLFFANYNVENNSKGVAITECDNKIQEACTNIEDIKKDLLAKYEKEALDEILANFEQKNPFQVLAEALEKEAQEIHDEEFKNGGPVNYSGAGFKVKLMPSGRAGGKNFFKNLFSKK